MVTEKASMAEGVKFHDYELVLVISPELDEERFQATIDGVSRFVADKGGVVADTERWGKRKLAYPIKHFEEGNYVLLKFKLPPVFGKELEANLSISEDVLRHLLIRLES